MSAEIQSNKSIVIGLLEQNTPVCFRAGGSSMVPTLRDGESVRIRPFASGDLRPGAILLYRKNDRLVLHRLVQNSSSLFFCGDAALNGLEPVDPADLLGTAVSVQRANRSIRLDTPAHRTAGMIRYRLRPLRRLLIKSLKFRKAEI